MKDHKTVWICFIIGGAVCAWPAWEISQRGLVVETTNFHIEPPVAKPGQVIEAIWTDKTLRTGCEGTVYRRFTGTQKGEKVAWVFPPISTVHHGKIGEVETFHSMWRAPRADPGTKVILQKNPKRSCGYWQAWFPMHDGAQEAEFMMAE